MKIYILFTAIASRTIIGVRFLVEDPILSQSTD
jgi:hypothetical protein